MLAYVDESGDMGMKIDKNSSPLFVVTAVLFYDRGEADRCYRAIESLRDELSIRNEFHTRRIDARSPRFGQAPFLRANHHAAESSYSHRSGPPFCLPGDVLP